MSVVPKPIIHLHFMDNEPEYSLEILHPRYTPRSRKLYNNHPSQQTLSQFENCRRSLRPLQQDDSGMSMQHNYFPLNPDLLHINKKPLTINTDDENIMEAKDLVKKADEDGFFKWHCMGCCCNLPEEFEEEQLKTDKNSSKRNACGDCDEHAAKVPRKELKHYPVTPEEQTDITQYDDDNNKQ